MLQNYFMRIILKKCKRDSSFPLYTQLKILPVQHLFVFKVLRLFYIRSGELGFINLTYSARGLNQGIFRTPKVNRSMFRHSYKYLGPKYFNKLPLELKLCASVKRFIFLLKDWLLSIEDIHLLNNVLA